MIDMQQAMVADHISRLDDEAAALRAERRRPRRIGAAPSPRVRFGRWRVGVGTAIAGPGRPVDDDATSLPHFA